MYDRFLAHHIINKQLPYLILAGKTSPNQYLVGKPDGAVNLIAECGEIIPFVSHFIL
jgi:hypothetical protein